MAIPDYQTIMLPFLQFAGDQKEHSIREAIEYICKLFKLNEEEKNELLPSGQQTTIENRVGWARTYIKKAGLLESTRRSFFKITPRGLEVLKSKPTAINIKYLEQFPEFIQFRILRKDEGSIQQEETYGQQTPLESLEYGYQKIRRELSQDILKLIKSCSPKFFEKLVVDLLKQMGYGASRESVRVTGKSGDEGIDGVINQDKLGLDNIYIQAKRWEGTVGRPEIHKFVGALQGQRSKKGIFITTSTFSPEAVDYVSKIDTKIVLINGEELAQHMIDYGIGVSKKTTYEIKEIDSDYFSEE